VISYGPAKLFVDFHKEIFGHIIFMQVIYIVAGLLLLWMVYKKGRIKIDINGG
ncbi:ABC transporter permease, partial [bacterium 1XD42-8]